VLTLPEGKTRVEQFAGAKEVVVLREELRASRKKINDLEKGLRHPYVQFGQRQVLLSSGFRILKEDLTTM
jgi:hypothetical protein